MLDAQAESHTAMHADRRTLNSLIVQISKEFEDQLRQVKPLGSRWEVGEIFCSSQSPIIQQIHNLGAKGFRFGYQEGDLSTKEGRGKLFRMIGTHRPRSLWYSPVCGPWSSWSNLNASLSLQHWQDHQALRHDMLYQLALGIVLYRHQVSNGDHMHWEQPGRSLMFKQPGMSELQCHMQTCEFDMCQAGGLRDPVNHMFMKKPMQLMTTSKTMYHTLHGMKCNHQHQHQTIEGTTYNNQGAILRTKFSEVYPRKFARTIAKTMMQLHGEKPFHWSPKIHLRYAAEPTQPVHAATTGNRPVRDRFPRSELISPLPETEVMAKRRRITGKHSPHVTKEMCEQFMKTIQQELPRVGKREIISTTAWSQIQEIFHDKEIVRMIACRGTDRTLGPPTGLHPEEAPYRRTIMEIRESKEVRFEAYWERWDQLSYRQLIRPAHPCKINVTVFGRDRNLNSAAASTPTVETPPEPPSMEVSVDATPGSTPQVEEPVEPAVPFDKPKPMQQFTTPSVENPAPSSELMEARLRFQSLAPWEKQMLRQMHTNLGHPSNERLCKALQAQGYRPEIIQAARELPCVTCAKCSPPKHQRPAALKQMFDFNHKIYLDAINWTNKAGKTLHFYHILDAGSSYHVAIASPSNTSTNIIRLLQQHWCSWAGIPSELVVDSGTELNSQEFQTFLQQYGIRCTTTNPEAHWQSGRVERHGSFLQSMLTKVDQEMEINDYHDLQASLNQCTSAKNTLSTRHGYSPEIIVFGRQSRLPGSILNDEAVPSHLQALQETSDISTNDFKRTLQLRETARRAYHAADNCDALRKAVLRRSCPHRGQYERGSWVMIWRTINVGEKKWLGPQRVIIQDGNHTVWTTQCGRIYRSAPENVRPSMPEEGQPEGPDLPEDVTPHEQQIQALQIREQQQGSRTLDLPEENSSPDEPHTNNNDNQANSTGIDPNLEPEIIPDIPGNSSHSESIPQPDSEAENASPPASTPTPSDTEDPEIIGLTCHEPEDAFTCSEGVNAAWCCEFDIPLSQPLENHLPSEEETWLLLATSAKKQRSEVKLTELTREERMEFDKAKKSEIANWIQTGTLTKVLRNQIPEEQILRSRWILTWKPLDQSEQTQTKSHKAKARLVILGYLDPQIENIPRDSPTLNKTSRMLILQVLATHMWQACSFDIKAAFLQGQPQSSRVMGLDPVPEMRQAMSMKPNEIGRLNKGAYGLIDAPYLWYCALVKELTNLGFETSPFDPCLFILREPQESSKAGQVAGILGIHVDDGIGGGNEYYHHKIAMLEKKFPFGSKKMSNFTFTGIEINQRADSSIVLSQSAYVRKIAPIAIDPNRKTQSDLKVTEPERLALRGVIGSLQYAAINTRPDLSSRLSMLQSNINQATIETLQEANKLLHEAKKHHDMTITIKSIPEKDFRFMAFSDASFSSASKPDSHAGLVIVGTHQNILKNHQCPISPISWGCRKIQKVVVSTLAAETMSLSAALDQLAWLRIFWSWIHDRQTQWKHPEQALERIPEAISSPTFREHPDVAVTDCKSLFDLTTRTAPPSCTEFRTQLVARAIKESLQEGVALRWVSSGAQLADSLTKAMDAHFLRETLRVGTYRLCDEEATLKARAKTRDRIKWLREQHETSSTNKEEFLGV
jgi:hypothetical protein